MLLPVKQIYSMTVLFKLICLAVFAANLAALSAELTHLQTSSQLIYCCNLARVETLQIFSAKISVAVLYRADLIDMECFASLDSIKSQKIFTLTLNELWSSDYSSIDCSCKKAMKCIADKVGGISFEALVEKDVISKEASLEFLSCKSADSERPYCQNGCSLPAKNIFELMNVCSAPGCAATASVVVTQTASDGCCIPSSTTPSCHMKTITSLMITSSTAAVATTPFVSILTSTPNASITPDASIIPTASITPTTASITSLTATASLQSSCSPLTLFSPAAPVTREIIKYLPISFSLYHTVTKSSIKTVLFPVTEVSTASCTFTSTNTTFPIPASISTTEIPSLSTNSFPTLSTSIPPYQTASATNNPLSTATISHTSSSMTSQICIHSIPTVTISFSSTPTLSTFSTFCQNSLPSQATVTLTPSVSVTAVPSVSTAAILIPCNSPNASNTSQSNEKTVQFLSNLVETLRQEMANLKTEISERIRLHSRKFQEEIENVRIQRRLSELLKMNQKKSSSSHIDSQKSKEILQIQSLLNKVSSLHEKTREKLQSIEAKKHQELISKQHESQNAALNEILSFLQKSKVEQAAFDSKCSSESRIMKKLEETSAILAKMIKERQINNEQGNLTIKNQFNSSVDSNSSLKMDQVMVDNVIGFIKNGVPDASLPNFPAKKCPRREISDLVKLALSRYISTGCKSISTFKLHSLSQSPYQLRLKVKEMLDKLHLDTLDSGSPYLNISKLLNSIVFSLSAKLQQIGAGCPPPNYDKVQYFCEKIKEILQ